MFTQALGRLGLDATTCPGLAAWAQGESPFAVEAVRLAVWALLMLVATGAAAVALRAVARASERQLAEIGGSRWLRRTALVFGALALLAYPTFTQDPWMSVAWGRMWAAGVSPYHHGFTEAALAGLPMAPFDLTLTYGPLWAWISSAVGWAGGESPWLAILALKLVLFGCWAASLGLVEQATAGQGRRQAVAVVLFGWLPLSAHFSLAEAHNDIAMVVALLAWLALAARRCSWASVALVASVLIKYVTLPLLALEAWRSWRQPRRHGRRRALGALAGACVTAALVTLPFLREGSILGATGAMRFRVLSPGKALFHLTERIPGPVLGPAAADRLVALALVALLLPLGLRFLRETTVERMLPVVFVAMLAAALVGTGHTWPWYLLWPLAVGCLGWDSPLFRASLSLFLVAPFFDLFWLQQGAWQAGDPWGLALWAAVVAGAWPCARLLGARGGGDQAA